MLNVLARAEVALGKLQVVPIGSLLPELQVGSADGEEVDLYGGFSPRARPCSMVSTDIGGEVIVEDVAPVLQIMPELTVLCEESPPPLFGGDSEGDGLARGFGGAHDTLTTALGV